MALRRKNLAAEIISEKLSNVYFWFGSGVLLGVVLTVSSGILNAAA